ncbi:hypothetical protein C8R46DRAFT_1044854 [Mycena filopes]|nr:hypothetical protein C8R46DRAFT_1044854 [Mycena filopes]
MSSNRFLPAFDVELDDPCGPSCSLWIVQNLSCNATTLIRGGSRSKSIWIACNVPPEHRKCWVMTSVFRANPGRPPWLRGLIARWYCEDALRPSGLPPCVCVGRVVQMVPGPSALHHRMITHRSTGATAALTPCIRRPDGPHDFTATSSHTADESVRAGQCDEDDLRSHRSELVLAHRGPARSLCAVLPLSETDRARSRRRTLSSAAPFPYPSRLHRGQSIPHRPPVDLVDAGRRTFDPAAVAMSTGTDASSLPPLQHPSGNARGQVWGRLIASTASPPTGAMARFWASDMGPILTTSTLGLTLSQLGELTATGTTRTTPPITVMSPRCRCAAIETRAGVHDCERTVGYVYHKNRLSSTTCRSPPSSRTHNTFQTSPPSPAGSFPPSSPYRACGGDKCEEAGLHGVQQIVTTRLKAEPALATLFSHRDPRPPPPGYGPATAPAVHDACHSAAEGRASFAPDLTKERLVSAGWSMQEERNAYGSRCLDTRGAQQSRPREHRHSIGGFAGRPRHMASPSRSLRPLLVLPLLLPSTAMQRAEANPLVCGRPLTTSTGDIGGSSVPGSRNSKMGSPSLDRESAHHVCKGPRGQSSGVPGSRNSRMGSPSLGRDERAPRRQRPMLGLHECWVQSAWGGDCREANLIAGKSQFRGTHPVRDDVGVESDQWDRLASHTEGLSCSGGTLRSNDAENSVSRRGKTRRKPTYCDHAVAQSAWGGDCWQLESVAGKSQFEGTHPSERRDSPATDTDTRGPAPSQYHRAISPRSHGGRPGFAWHGNDRAKVVQSAHQIDLLRDPPRIKVVALQERFCTIQREQEGPHGSSSSTSNAGRKRLDDIFRVLSGQARTLLVPAKEDEEKEKEG